MVLGEAEEAVLLAAEVPRADAADLLAAEASARAAAGEDSAAAAAVEEEALVGVVVDSEAVDVGGVGVENHFEKNRTPTAVVSSNISQHCAFVYYYLCLCVRPRPSVLAMPLKLTRGLRAKFRRFGVSARCVRYGL